MIEIREATQADQDAIWMIFRQVIEGRDAFPFDPSTSREDGLAHWFGPAYHTYVAVVDGVVVGSSYIKANQPGLGSHVANGGFMVKPEQRREGVGRALGEHAVREAKRLGFLGMQFNFVISTNTPAVELWKKLGFTVVGTIPGGFRHGTLGLVDVYVMYRAL